MGKVTKAIEHLTKEEIEEKIKTTVGFWRVKRWMVIRHASVWSKFSKRNSIKYRYYKVSII